MGSRYNWVNNDGLVVTSGRRTVDNDQVSASAARGQIKELVTVVNEGEIAQSAAVAGRSCTLPAGATITDVKLFSTGPLTGLVDLIVGIADEDGGSDITDADGLVLAVDAAEVVALRPSGTVVGTAFDGALLTAAAPLAEEAVVTWSVTTASSDGDVKVVITYTL